MLAALTMQVRICMCDSLFLFILGYGGPKTEEPEDAVRLLRFFIAALPTTSLSLWQGIMEGESYMLKLVQARMEVAMTMCFPDSSQTA